jgi:hypothetical protein
VLPAAAADVAAGGAEKDSAGGQEALRDTPLVAWEAESDLTGEEAAVLVPPRDSSQLAVAVLSVLPIQARALSAAALKRARTPGTDAIDAAMRCVPAAATRRGLPG